MENITNVGSGYSTDVLSIGGNDGLTSLQGLHNLTDVDGNLRINANNSLMDLSGLTKLERVENTFTIFENDLLTSFNGLNSIDHCGELKIEGNLILPNLQGLSNLNSLDKLTIINSPLTNLTGLPSSFSVDEILIENNSFPNLDGLQGITSTVTINILNNPSLINLVGLENLQTVDFFYIKNNSNLTSLTGLTGLINVNEIFEIENNGLITLSGLNNLGNVGNGIVGYDPHFYIQDNSSLQHLTGLGNLFSVDGRINIVNNNSLQDMTGLEMFSFARYFNISNNDNLVTVDGLSNFSIVEHRLFIFNNMSLISLAGISALQNVNSIPTIGITISSNPLLSFCSIEGVCNLIENFPSLISISNNALGCNDVPEAEAGCNCTVIFYYPDTDNDGFGDGSASPSLGCQGDPPPSNHVTNGLDCDDSNPNDVDLVINNNPIIADIYEANSSITSAGIAPINSPKITFQAGETIFMTTGFLAEEGTDFEAKLEYCGIPPSNFVKKNVEELELQNEVNKQLTNEISELSFSLTPNPVQNTLLVNLDSPNQETYQIFDIIGNEKISGKLNSGRNQILVNELNKGIYIFKISDKTSKFIKM